jgi:hypothetical protein
MHHSRPEFQFLRTKGASKTKRGRRDWERKGYQNSLVRGNVKKSWVSDSKWGISHPPVSPKRGFLPIFHMISSPQLKEVFNFIYAAPELGATLIRSGKDVVRVKVLGLKELKPQIVVFIRIKQSPNPFCH